MLDGPKMWSVAAAWVDYNNDGLLDLFVVNYCSLGGQRRSASAARAGIARLLPSQELQARCRTALPQQRRRHLHRRLRETGSLRISARAWASPSPTTTATASWTSFVANDNMPTSSSTTSAARSSKRSPSKAEWPTAPNGYAISGMGADFRDVNNDGLPDIWHTAIENETFPLYVNTGGRRVFQRGQRSGSPHLQHVRVGQRHLRFRQRRLERPLRRASNVLDNIAR